MVFSDSDSESKSGSVFGNDRSAFDDFSYAIDQFEDARYDGDHNAGIAEFLVRLVSMVRRKSYYSDKELRMMFWAFADFHLPVHLLRVVLQKLELLPGQIPVLSYANYLATCVALIQENVRDQWLGGQYREKYMNDTATYLTDLLNMFNWESPYYIAAEEGDPTTIREFMEREENGMVELLEMI